MVSSSLTLHLHLPPTILFHRHQTPSQLSLSPFHLPNFSSSHSPKAKISSSSSSSSSWEQEEERWKREESRWLREEQRWLREESRWNSQRQSLLQEIATLQNRIQALESLNSLNSVNSVQGSSVLAELSTINHRISESGSGPVPLILESKTGEEEVVKEVVVNEIRVSEEEKVIVKKEKKKMASLRKGAEGDQVRKMQEALQNLGFYCGEEDTEYSSFTSGTERAVKTWQASLGAPEDGIMTEKLLEKLFTEQGLTDAGLNLSLSQNEKGTNGSPVASTIEVSENSILEENGAVEFEASHHRVFLLGENRWEDSSRLMNRDKKVSRRQAEIDAMKCITCRGEGRLLCSECDGTGEPNIEEQFLEWVDEGAKCPYCEGLGYTICDVCDGKTIIKI